MNMLPYVKHFTHTVFSHGKGLMRLATASFRRLPDAVIIGTMKGGTSSLFRYLSQHPEVHESIVKEVHYFDTNFHRGLRWYRSHFPLRRDGLVLEATPKYMFHEASLQRLYALMPHAVLIAILREPVSRAYSHYQHMRRYGREERTFEEAVCADMDVIRSGRFLGGDLPEESYYSYLRRSLYAPQLERSIEAYNNRLLVLCSRNLFEHPQATIDQVCDFLNLSRFTLDATRVYNAGTYHHEIPMKEELEVFFQPYNERLYGLLGIEPWWPYTSMPTG